MKLTVEQIIKLGDMGYTKAEIDAFNSQEPEKTSSPVEPKPAVNPIKEEPKVDPEPVKAEEPVSHAEPNSEKAQQVIYQMTQDQIRDFAQKIALGTSGYKYETPKDIEGVLEDHLNALMKGE